MKALRWRGSRRNPAHHVHLVCAERTVGIDAVVELPTVMVVVVEDVCAQLAYEDWSGRRPAGWSLAERRRWRAEGHLVRDKIRRVRELAVECLDGDA